jgi:hypothetical protein
MISIHVREVLKAEGFAHLPRRLDEERPERPRPTIEAPADVRQLSLTPRRFDTACGGLFLFVPGLVSLALDKLAKSATLPGSKMIPASHALRSMLVLKLWSIEHRSHVMPHVADQGLSLLAGLNVIPKRRFLSEYSSRVRCLVGGVLHGLAINRRRIVLHSPGPIPRIERPIQHTRFNAYQAIANDKFAGGDIVSILVPAAKALARFLS